MSKSTQYKIIIIFLIISILTIIGFGVYMYSSLEYIKQSADNLRDELNNLEQQIWTIVIAVIGIAIIIALVMVKISSKFVIFPISKLLEKANSTENEEEFKNKNKDKIREKNKDKTMDEDVLEIITEELKIKLNKISTQKNQMETILLHMTDGIIAFNLEGDIILINPAARKFLSILPEDINFEDIFSKFNLNINMEKIIYLENWTSTEQRIEVEDKHVNVFFAPFRDEKERPNGIIAVIQDITEHVKLDNLQKEFVADVSHELKTPITSIMGYAETLLELEYDKETQDKFLNVIATEAKRMATLVTDLLTLSRYDNNKKYTNIESFDLGELVKKCQDKVAIEIKKKNQNVKTFVTADVPPVYADKHDIERVVLNILTNSIKYTKEAGEINIYIGFVYNDAYIKIIDNGIGIPAADLSRIFDRFYRVDKARTREMGGTGLGLSIAKEILDKNAGTIDIKSAVGEGTEVVIKIPTKQ